MSKVHVSGVDATISVRHPDEVPAHELTKTRDCRMANCTGVATGHYDRGRLANLCEEHEQIERRKLSEHGRNGGRQKAHLTSAEKRDAGPSFETRARALVAVGKRLDMAAAALRRQQAGVESLRRDLAEALREWRRACAALAGDGPG